MSLLDGLPVVPKPSKEYLNERQLTDYRSQREQCLTWLLTLGKVPERAEGYARETLKTRAYRMDRFHRFVWKDIEEGYTAAVTHDHANQWLRDLAQQEISNAHAQNHRKALRLLFKWREHEHGLDRWEPEINFSVDDGASNPRDYLTLQERQQIREAALEYGSIPSYKSVTPQERDRWKAYLAQRFEKPKADINRSDWERANGWKIPSLVSVSLDAGLRPIEVERAVVSWVDIDNKVLRIPKEESSKNTDNWIVGLQDRTCEFLRRWLMERANYDQYSSSDSIWLTRQGNPYNCSSLRYLIRRLCEIASIDFEHRKMSWYAIRHSTGTYMTREEDLAAAQAQLRHRSTETTMKYDQTPVEDRRNALNRMG